LSGSWETWYLAGGAVSGVPLEQLLVRNGRLAGPGKFVLQANGASCCRFDVPRGLRHDQTAAEHAVQAWAEAVTAIAMGSALEPAPGGKSPEVLAAFLSEKGWSATAADGGVRVSLSLPGLFRQITVEAARVTCTRLQAELVDLAGWPEPCRRAAFRFAHAANVRLRLVRLALSSESAAEPLLAEIHLASAQVPGTWLEVAMEALAAALALSARELSALRDPELAQWFLAATAAGKEDRSDDLTSNPGAREGALDRGGE
jgi:hypothetical protein